MFKDERTRWQKFQDWLFGTTWSGMFARALIHATAFTFGALTSAFITLKLFGRI